MVLEGHIEESTERIQTIRPDGKKGMWISMKMYSDISGIIFHQIKNSPEVTLVKVIDETRLTLANQRNIELITLHVKLDLESRGYIETIQSKLVRNRVILKVTSKGWRHFRWESDSRYRVEL